MKLSSPIFRRTAGGFTLIEIITASIAAALILLAIYGLFQRAVKMRDHATERTRAAQLRARAEKVIRNDLRNAFVSGTSAGRLASTLEGGKQSQKSRFPGYLRFTTTTGKETPSSMYGDVQQVEYSISDAGTTDASSNSGTFTRTITRDLLSTLQTTTPTEEQLLTHVSSFDVTFYDGQTWQESWEYSNTNPTLPLAFRVRIKQDAPSDQSSTPPVLEIMERMSIEPLSSGTTSATGTTVGN